MTQLRHLGFVDDLVSRELIATLGDRRERLGDVFELVPEVRPPGETGPEELWPVDPGKGELAEFDAAHAANVETLFEERRGATGDFGRQWAFLATVGVVQIPARCDR